MSSYFYLLNLKLQSNSSFISFFSRCYIAKCVVSLSTSFALNQRIALLRRTRKTGAVAAASSAMCVAGKTSSQR